MSVINLPDSCTVSLVQLTVQCCIHILCCGFQFALQFVLFNLRLHYVVIQFAVSCTISLVQLTVECCIQNECCDFHFALQFVIFNLLLQYVCHSVDCHL